MKQSIKRFTRRYAQQFSFQTRRVVTLHGAIWACTLVQIAMTVFAGWAFFDFVERELVLANAKRAEAQLRSVRSKISSLQRSNTSEWSRAIRQLNQRADDLEGKLWISGPLFAASANSPDKPSDEFAQEKAVLREHVSVDWRSKPVQIHVQTPVEIDRRTFLVSIRNAADWNSLLTSSSAIYGSCFAAIFLLLQFCVLLVIVAILNSPVRSLTSTLRAINRDDNGQPLTESARIVDPDVASLTQQLEQLIRRREQALTSQRALLRDLSHELRTPLTALRSVGELALTRAVDVIATREAVQSMLEEATHMQSLIEGLLMLARASEIVPPDKTEVVDCAALVGECVAAMLPVAEERLQSLSSEAVASAQFFGSYTIARQALLNLILNASNHCPVGSAISVSVSAPLNDRRIHLTVSDNGPGIEESEQELIFQRFRRGKQTERDIEGHGLGLAIAKAFVNAQGGMLTLKSKPGEGSHFTMSYRRLRCPQDQRREELESSA